MLRNHQSATLRGRHLLSEGVVNSLKEEAKIHHQNGDLWRESIGRRAQQLTRSKSPTPPSKDDYGSTDEINRPKSAGSTMKAKCNS